MKPLHDRTPNYLSTVIAAVLGSAPAAALSQQTSGPALEEITVTARLIEESLQDAPVSVSAFTAEELRIAGLTDITDISFLTPGLSMQSNSRINEQPFIRGMSVNSFFRPVQTTSSFIDGIYVQGLGRTADLVTEVDRVEVIRGPQSALFGRATFAGAINYITKRPTYDPELMVVATAGQNDRYEVSLNGNLPLIDDLLATRVNLRYNEYEGQFRDASDGAVIGDQETKSASIQFRLTPGDSVDAVLRYAHTEIDDGHTANVLLGRDILNYNAGGTFDVYNGVLPTPPDSAVDITRENIDGGYRTTEQDRVHLIVDWSLGDHTLTAATHWSEEQYDYYIDGDLVQLSALGGLFESRFTEDFEDFSFDLRLASPRNDRFRWLAGLYYYDSEYIISQLASNVVPGDPRNERNYSVYGSAEYDFTDAWSIAVDARYQDEEVTRERATTGEEFRKATTKSFLPRVIVNFRPREEMLWYVSASKGVQPADFNTGANTPPEYENLDEQELWSYELGLKSSFAGNRYRLNAAAFFIDWDGQLSRFVTIGTDGSVANLNVNAGKTEIKGVEASFEAALTDQLTLLATYAYTDAEYKRFDSQNCERAFGFEECDGNKLQNVPENQFSLSMTWNFPLTASWSGYLRGDLSYRDEQFVDEINIAKAPDVTLLNARLGFESDRFGVTLWGRNLTDEDSPEFATRFLDLTGFPFTTGYQLALRQERQFGVTATLRF